MLARPMSRLFRMEKSRRLKRYQLFKAGLKLIEADQSCPMLLKVGQKASKRQSCAGSYAESGMNFMQTKPGQIPTDL